jgi:hypothetical protein
VTRIHNDFGDYAETKSLIDGWESWLPTGRVSNGSKYNGCRLFIKPSSLEHWLGPAAEDVSLQKTGAPGRPSNMPAVMEEHRRRVASGESANSRAAEASELEAWVKERTRVFNALQQRLSKIICLQTFGPRRTASRNKNIGCHFGNLFREALSRYVHL